jgi:hypothetical protein
MRTLRSHGPLAAAAAGAAVAYLVNLRGAVDFDLDEVMYTLAGRNVATHGSVSWNGTPIAVHPPLHFLLLGAWALATGTAHAPILDALMAARYLGAILSVLAVLVTGLLARLYCRDTRLAVAAMALVTVDGFVLRFGRTALIEPTAILAGLVVVYLALRLRTASTPVYAGVVGAASGLALLVKEPLLFTVLAPVLAAILGRDRVYLRKSCAAIAVAAGVWAVFPLWALTSGAGGWWWAQHRTSLDRLAGILQVSGMNRAGVSSTGIFGSTIMTYLSGYLIFGLGAVGLLRLAWTAGLFHGRRVPHRPASLIAFAALSYGFLAWCVLFGQANEQLTVYSAGPAALVCVLGWGRPLPRTAIAACALVLLVGAAAWALTVASAHDDATARMGRYVTAHDPCVPVNATGDALRWTAVLPRTPVRADPDGPAASASGVHLFLLSRKDSALHYGVSSPALDGWVRSHGRPVLVLASRRYDSIELWSVPGPVRFGPCGTAAPPVAGDASVARFLTLLLVALLTIGVGAGLLRRRSP